MKKTSLTVILTFLAILVVSSSCGNAGNKTTTDPAPATDLKKVLTYTRLEPGDTLEKYVGSYLEQELKERFAIEFKTEIVPNTGLTETLRLRCAGGELPDVSFNMYLGTDFMNELGKDGYYLDFSPYLDLVPNYRKTYTDKQWAEFVDLYASESGALYGLCTQAIARIGEGWIYNKGAFDKLGLSFPKTLDEYYDCLKVIKNADPRAYVANRNGFGWLSQGYQWAYRVDPASTFYVDPDTDEFLYARNTDKWREMLIFMNKLYADDLIYPEFATSTMQQFSEIVAQGQCYILYEYFARASWAQGLVSANDPDAEWTFSLDYISAYTDRDAALRLYNSYWACGLKMSSEVDEERIIRMLEAYDWCTTLEGQIAVTFGPEGGEWDYNENNEIELHPNMYSMYNLEGDTRRGEGYIGAAHPRFYYYEGDNVFYLIDKVLDNFDHFAKFRLFYSDADQITISDFGTVVNDVAGEWQIMFTIGNKNPANDNDWQEYLNALQSAGLEKVSAIMTNAYNARYGN